MGAPMRAPLLCEQCHRETHPRAAFEIRIESRNFATKNHGRAKLLHVYCESCMDSVFDGPKDDTVSLFEAAF